MDENRQLKIDVVIGAEAEKLFQSELGQHLIEEHLKEIAELHDRFENIDPLDVAEMQRVHFDIRVARYGIKKLNAFINAGMQAIEVLSEE